MQPRARVSVYGSAAAELDTFASDIDLGATESLPWRDRGRHLLLALERRLRRAGWAHRLKTILQARVPIATFIDRLSGVAVDISCPSEPPVHARAALPPRTPAHPAGRPCFARIALYVLPCLRARYPP